MTELISQSLQVIRDLFDYDSELRRLDFEMRFPIHETYYVTIYVLLLRCLQDLDPKALCDSIDKSTKIFLIKLVFSGLSNHQGHGAGGSFQVLKSVSLLILKKLAVGFGVYDELAL